MNLVKTELLAAADDDELGAGDIAVFPLGWKGTWDIHETVRKVYSIF